MAQFKFTAENKEGERYEETIEAADRFAVYAEIRNRGDRVVAVSEEGKRGLLYAFTNFELLGGISTDEKILFAKNLGAMIDAGLALSRALSVMDRQTKNKKLKEVFAGLMGSVKRGDTFASAIAKYPKVFSPLFASMVRAGEESGSLAKSLKVVALQMERSHNLVKKVKGALIYPSIVITVMIGIGILMLIYVVPTLTQTFSELHTQLPPTTQLIITLSNFLVAHTILALSGMVAFVAVVIGALRSATGKRVVDTAILYIPVIGGIVRETNAARTARTLSSLLSAGVDVVLAITITRDVVQNHNFQKVLSQAEEAVTKGDALSKAFSENEHLYPALVGEMMAVGEETGKVSPMLEEIAIFYESEVEEKTKDISTIIEPMLMVVIGAGVGFFAVSMIAPIYSLSNSI